MISDCRHVFLSSKMMAIGIFHAKFKVDIPKIKRGMSERLRPKHVYLAI